MTIKSSIDHNEIQQWRADNPSGCICNSQKPIIHKATCYHHLGPILLAKNLHFNLGNKEKILADSIGELIEYLKNTGEIFKCCSHCVKNESSMLNSNLLTERQNKILYFFLTRESKSGTASEIAKILDLKNAGAVNFEIWKIAEKLSPYIPYTPEIREDGSKQWWPALFDGYFQDNGTFLWTIKPNIESLIFEYDIISNSASSTFKADELALIASKNDLPQEIPTGTIQPRSIYRNSKVYERDKAIKVYLASKLGCICEMCGWKSDILDENGDAYIEMHHIKMLADGGSDTISNSILVCPNCHRKLHYSSEKDEIIRQLYAKIHRLIPE